MMEPKKAVDLSHHNGSVDFEKLKASGIDIVILRTGYGRYSPSQMDRRFAENYDLARKCGMDIGAYHYSYADSPDDAVLEAEAMLRIIGGRRFELPLYFDIEERKHSLMPREVCSEMVSAFCGTLEKNGCFAGVYSYDSFFVTNLSGEIPERYSAWVAKISKGEPRCKRYDVRQYSFTGRPAGTSGYVDMDMVYRDFPSIMRKTGLNGYHS